MLRATLLLGMTAGALASCGRGPAPADEPVDFTGAPWTVTLTTRIDCGAGQTGQIASTGQVGFIPASRADEIVTISEAGCTLELRVTGNTAVLVNGPVACGTSSNGQAFEYSYGSYTATIVDGANLTLAALETENFGGTLCRLEISGTGTR
jgi:hypothetical protein